MQEGNYAALFVYWNYTQSLSTAYAIAIFDSKYEKEILDKIRQLDPNVRSN